MTQGPLSGSTVGRYELRDQLGAGGMGVVYEAWDPRLGRRVALKLLDPNVTSDPRRVERFRVEARAASVLTHPAIVTVYEIGEAESAGGGTVQFIAMELVVGRKLSSWLESRPSIPAVLTLVGELADAVSSAHRGGVVHRDLKPDNIMVVAGGRPKILDFGVAKLTEVETAHGGAPSGRAPLTRPATILGTVGYMSPEQVEGLPVDHRSDIFSTGCILYECLTGREPFPGSTVAERLHATVHSMPPPLPQHPSRLQRIVNRCLAKERENRYDSAKDLALDLAEAADPALEPRASARPTARRWLRMALTATAVALLLIPLVTIGSTLIAPPTDPQIQRLEQSLGAEQEKNRRLAELLERQRLDREQDERLRAELERSYRDLLFEVRDHVKTDASEQSRLRQRLTKADAELESYRQQLTRREKAEQLARLSREVGSYIDTRFEEDRLVVTFNGSHFRPGRTAIDFQAHPILRYLAQELRQMSDVYVHIEGHTDDSGNAMKNLALSQLRADGVREILIASGVDAARISAIGRGEVLPVHDNSTLDGRNLNRRVELSISYEPST